MSITINPQEDEFLEAFKDVRPLAKNDKVIINDTKGTLAQKLKRQAIEEELRQNRNHLCMEAPGPIDPYELLSFKKDGVQHEVFKNLRLGKYNTNPSR